jgi:hypothetical protein
VSATGGAAGAGGECPGNPSGYACDAWSVHLYPTNGVRREASQLRFQIRHDPDLEGYPEDIEIAPGHEFVQVLTVNDLTPAVHDYLCTVLVPDTGGADRSVAAGFSNTVSPYVGASLLAILPNDYISHPDNVVDMGAGPLAPIVNPSPVASPTLPDIVLVLPLEPNPTGFQGRPNVLGMARTRHHVGRRGERAVTRRHGHDRGHSVMTTPSTGSCL